MKRCRSVEEVVEVVKAEEAAAVKAGLVSEDASNEFVKNFAEECKRFFEAASVIMMLVFEGDEIEDEEFGMALCEVDDIKPEWELISLSARCSECRFTSDITL